MNSQLLIYQRNNMKSEKVICNTSPIIGLLSIRKIIPLMGVVWWNRSSWCRIQRALRRFIRSSVHQKELIEIKEYVSKGYLKIYKVKNAAMVKSMYGKLHFGELEVIVATKELGLHLAIIDEKAVRKMASEFLYDSFTNLFLIALNLRVHCIFASLSPAIFVSSGLIKISSKNVDQFFLSILLVGNLQVEQNPRFPHHLHLHYLTTNHMSCHLQSFWLSYRCS